MVIISDLTCHDLVLFKYMIQNLGVMNLWVWWFLCILWMSGLSYMWETKELGDTGMIIIKSLNSFKDAW